MDKRKVAQEIAAQLVGSHWLQHDVDQVLAALNAVETEAVKRAIQVVKNAHELGFIHGGVSTVVDALSAQQAFKEATIPDGLVTDGPPIPCCLVTSTTGRDDEA